MSFIFSEHFELHALQPWPAEPNWYKLRSASAVFNSSVRYGAAAHAFGMGLNEFNRGRKQPRPEPIAYPQSALHSTRAHTKSLVRILTTCKLELEQTNQLQGFYFLLACARPGCGKKKHIRRGTLQTFASQVNPFFKFFSWPQLRELNTRYASRLEKIYTHQTTLLQFTWIFLDKLTTDENTKFSITRYKGISHNPT